MEKSGEKSEEKSLEKSLDTHEKSLEKSGHPLPSATRGMDVRTFPLVLGNRFIKATHGFIFAGSDGKYMGNITSGVDQAFAGGTAVGIND